MDINNLTINKLNPKPENILIKSDAIYEIDDLCKRLRLGKNTLLVYDKTTKQIAGNTIESRLKGDFEVYAFTIDDADSLNIHKVCEYIKEKNVNFVLGIGGGRPIDVAKVSSYGTKTPFISVPTNASHDGIASGRASVNNNGQKVSYQAHSAIAVNADLKILLESPEINTRAGIGDAVSNLTAAADWKWAHELTGEEINENAYYHASLVYQRFLDMPEDFETITENSMKTIIYELIRSGKAMQLARSSRPASGWEHKISHALDKIAEKPDLHGKQCAHGTLISLFAHEAVGYPIDGHSSEKAIKAFDTIKLLSEPSVTLEETIKACRISNTINENRYTIGNNVDPKLAEQIIRTVYRLYETR